MESTDYVTLSSGLAAYPFVTDLCITGYLDSSWFASGPEIQLAYQYATRASGYAAGMTSYVNATSNVACTSTGPAASTGIPCDLISYQAYGPGTQTNGHQGLVAYYTTTLSKTFELAQYEGSRITSYDDGDDTTLARFGAPKVTAVTIGNPTVLTLQNDASGFQMGTVDGMSIQLVNGTGTCPVWAAGTYTVPNGGSSGNTVTLNFDSTGQTYTANTCALQFQPIVAAVSANSGTGTGAQSQICNLTLSTPLYITPFEQLGGTKVTLAGAASGNGNYLVWSMSSDGLTMGLQGLTCSSDIVTGHSPTISAPLSMWINSFRAAFKIAPNPSDYTIATGHVVTNNANFAANAGINPSIFDSSGRGAFETFDPDIFTTPNPNWPAFLTLSGGSYPYLLKRDLDPASNDNSPVGLRHTA